MDEYRAGCVLVEPATTLSGGRFMMLRSTRLRRGQLFASAAVLALACTGLGTGVALAAPAPHPGATVPTAGAHPSPAKKDKGDDKDKKDKKDAGDKKSAKSGSGSPCSASAKACV